eukprot:scaffold461766_cov33-Prasinocladus_malaysianus.AAC.1
MMQHKISWRLEEKKANHKWTHRKLMDDFQCPVGHVLSSKVCRICRLKVSHTYLAHPTRLEGMGETWPLFFMSALHLNIFQMRQYLPGNMLHYLNV